LTVNRNRALLHPLPDCRTCLIYPDTRRWIMARMTHEEFVRKLREPLISQKKKKDEQEEDDFQALLEKKFEELFGAVDDEDDS
jgi:hypothetical protein